MHSDTVVPRSGGNLRWEALEGIRARTTRCAYGIISQTITGYLSIDRCETIKTKRQLSTSFSSEVKKKLRLNRGLGVCIRLSDHLPKPCSQQRPGYSGIASCCLGVESAYIWLLRGQM